MQEGIVSGLDDEQLEWYYAGEVAGMGTPIGTVMLPNNKGVQKFTSFLTNKLDEFASHAANKWGSTWNIYALTNPEGTLVKMMDDKIVGAAMVTNRQLITLPNGKQALYLMGLEVLPEARGGGIGYELLQAVCFCFSVLN